MPYFTGLGSAALTTLTPAGRALIDDADIGAQRTTLGVPASATTLPATYGVDLVTNGAFTGSADGWTLGGGATYDTDNVNVVAGSTVEQTVNVVSGTLYQIEWTDTLTAGTITVELGTVSNINGYSISSDTWACSCF